MSVGFWLCLFIMVQIVQNMGYRAGIKQHGLSWEWLPVKSNDLPYSTVSDIIENVW